MNVSMLWMDYVDDSQENAWKALIYILGMERMGMLLVNGIPQQHN
jgi:hypothetical protein